MLDKQQIELEAAAIAIDAAAEAAEYNQDIQEVIHSIVSAHKWINYPKHSWTLARYWNEYDSASAAEFKNVNGNIDNLIQSIAYEVLFNAVWFNV